MFLGEKIGIEYLYSQTGQVLQSPLQQEEPKDDAENLELDKDDEGFYVSIFSLCKSYLSISLFIYVLGNIYFMLGNRGARR